MFGDGRVMPLTRYDRQTCIPTTRCPRPRPHSVRHSPAPHSCLRYCVVMGRFGTYLYGMVFQSVQRHEHTVFAFWFSSSSVLARSEVSNGVWSQKSFTEARQVKPASLRQLGLFIFIIICCIWTCWRHPFHHTAARRSGARRPYLTSPAKVLTVSAS